MEEINLYDLLRYYAQKWLVIISIAIGGAGIGIVYAYFIQQPVYESSATVLLLDTERTTANQESVTLNNYMELMTSRRVLEPVIDRLNYSGSYDTLVENITVTNARGTDMITVSMSTNNARTSRALLESTLQEFGEQARNLYGDTSVRTSVVDAASEPNNPSNVKPVQQIGLATAAAIALAFIILFFMFDYKNSRRSKEESQQKSRPTTASRKKKEIQPLRSTDQEADDPLDSLINEIETKARKQQPQRRSRKLQ